jgi:hypothetical protein
MNEWEQACSHCGKVFAPTDFYEVMYCSIECGAKAGHKPEDFEE